MNKNWYEYLPNVVRTISVLDNLSQKPEKFNLEYQLHKNHNSLQLCAKVGQYDIKITQCIQKINLSELVII